MKVSKIKIKNLFGVEEISLEGKDYEIVGDNRTGKTSILEAIRYALRRRSDKDLILRKGAEEGEILIETDTGIIIRRRERQGKASIDTVKDGKTLISKKEGFLRDLFSEIQLNPVDFIALPKNEQNRIILDLFDFKWDIGWIKKQFGEIVPEVDYDQNILKILADIQAEGGYYYRTRQEIQREARNKTAFVEEIAKSLPDKYKASDWENRNLSDIYRRIETIRAKNRTVEKARAEIETQEDKKRGFEADKEIKLSALSQEINAKRTRLEKDIIRFEEELKAAKKEISQLEDRRLERTEKIDLEYKAEVARFDEKIKEAQAAAKGETEDPLPLLEEAENIEKMKGLVSEYNRMTKYREEVKDLNKSATDLTAKIEKARTLPAEILSQAKLPLTGLTIDAERGIPLVNGLPISNLSDGEKLNLCVEIAGLQKNALNLLLIDGVEKLSERNRKKLYESCRDKGVQFIATRTTEDDRELTILELWEGSHDEDRKPTGSGKRQTRDLDRRKTVSLSEEL